PGCDGTEAARGGQGTAAAGGARSGAHEPARPGTGRRGDTRPLLYLGRRREPFQRSAGRNAHRPERRAAALPVVEPSGGIRPGAAGVERGMVFAQAEASDIVVRRVRQARTHRVCLWDGASVLRLTHPTSDGPRTTSHAFAARSSGIAAPPSTFDGNVARPVLAPRL